MYSFILMQLVCLIAGVMDLMKYVILLFMGTYGIMHKKLCTLLQMVHEHKV